MAQVKNNSDYIQYVAIGKAELDLPDFEADSHGYLVPYVGEVYCRAPDCQVLTRYLNTNNLKKHIRTAHGDDFDLLEKEGGGRPSAKEEADAIEFYKTLIQAYDAKKQAEKKTAAKPALPRRRDGKVGFF
ncbi:hypothetical protein BJX76DRAFT_343677 [Aspergillus varians]